MVIYRLSQSLLLKLINAKQKKLVVVRYSWYGESGIEERDMVSNREKRNNNYAF